MWQKKIKTTPDVCILESLNFMDEDSHREGEVVYRTLKMSGKNPYYVYIRSRDEMEAFVEEFGKSEYRYLHISCHGDTGTFFTTLDPIPSLDLVHMLAPHVNHRRVFLSTCLATDSKFATALMKNSDCNSVTGPVGTLAFDDATIFWTAFYHLMFKESPAMKNVTIQEKLQICSSLVNEEFRFFFWHKQKIIEQTIKPFA